MHGLILLAALAMPAPSRTVIPPHFGGAEASSPHGAPCRGSGVNRADQINDKVDARKLGDLPSGSLYLAVVRDVNGCREPTIVRYGYGATGRESQQSNSRTRHPK